MSAQRKSGTQSTIWLMYLFSILYMKHACTNGYRHPQRPLWLRKYDSEPNSENVTTSLSPPQDQPPRTSRSIQLTAEKAVLSQKTIQAWSRLLWSLCNHHLAARCWNQTHFLYKTKAFTGKPVVPYATAMQMRHLVNIVCRGFFGGGGGECVCVCVCGGGGGVCRRIGRKLMQHACRNQSKAFQS